ncbi:MAG: hypothetical protein HY904_02835 [Deltaproteobacteria bacterium]|nr:hypothetical protein [Deltaproteobacteria bacterium]
MAIAVISAWHFGQSSAFGHGTCVPSTGLCACDTGFTGPQCTECTADGGVYPSCP